MKKISLVQRCFILTICFLLNIYFINAQNTFPSTGSAGIGTVTPNASSLFEMKSTTQGVLIPRMSQAKRDLIASPVTGLLIYQTNGTTGFYYFDGSIWKNIAPVAHWWSLNGNSGTNPATNFIGTTDNQPLVFKINNQQAGYLGTFSTTNTAFGYQTLSLNTTGVSNTANGFQAMYANTTGAYNSANGVGTLYANTTGSNNTATGFWALTSNTTGYYNTASGGYALQNNINGISNTANGISSLRNNTSGSDNTGTGANTLFHNTTGYSNVAVGTNALFNNIAGSNNVAVGDSTLYSQNQGFYNSAVGSKALYSNTTGSYNTATGFVSLYTNDVGSYNTAIGFSALVNNNSGSSNTAIGESALNANTTGFSNTASGSEALLQNTTGYNNTASGYRSLYFFNDHDNTAFGWGALYSTSVGSFNTAIGSGASLNNSGPYNNSTALGANSLVSASNQVRIGNSSITSIGGYQSWTTLPSDKRVKKNIKENVPGLAFINKLKPVTYNIDINAIDNIVQRPAIKDKDGKTRQPSQEELDSRKAKEQIVFTGFLAQDVEAAATSLNYDFSGVDKPKNAQDLYGIRYSDFVMPLVKAVQELSKMNDEKDAKLNELETRLAKLESMMNNFHSISKINSALGSFEGAALFQNIPNPFSNATTISYSLPQKYSTAKIIVVDESGNIIKSSNLSGSGKGSIKFSSPFTTGTSYQYSLLIDGKLIETKQMILAK